MPEVSLLPTSGSKLTGPLGACNPHFLDLREGLPLRLPMNQAQRRRTFLVGQYQGVIARDHRAATSLSLR